MSAPTYWLVELEFGRVQTYLFAVSELKAMLGANTLLGEVLRGQLVEGQFVGEDNLPKLAVKHGAVLPPGALNEAPEGRPDVDPLRGADCDDPRASFAKGVLARDGGHFHAVFPGDRGDSEAFVREARELVGKHLPGLSVTAKYFPVAYDADAKRFRRGDESKGTDDATGADLLDLPQFQVCTVTQQGPAETTAREDNRDVHLSPSVRAKRETADRFDDGRSKDVLGLLRGQLFPDLTQRERLFPNAFETVAIVSGYLAVIAADGNGIGARSHAWRGPADPATDFFQREAKGEQFYHAMRAKVRIALVAALHDAFQDWADAIGAGRRTTLPFRLMMLGGDDLLLVCDAVYALPFLVNYATRLDEDGIKLPDGKRLHVGAGVAVVKKTFPFHRSHALAEQLAASAKRYYRSLPEDRRASTVDWLSISEAWHDDVAEVRRRDSLKRVGGETLVLSAKPYRILGDGESPADSLQSLLNAATAAAGTKDADSGRLARSQLMALANKVRLGRLQANFAYDWAPEEVRKRLRPVVPDDGSVWESVGSSQMTRVMDFLELYELERQRLAEKEQLESEKSRD